MYLFLLIRRMIFPYKFLMLIYLRRIFSLQSVKRSINMNIIIYQDLNILLQWWIILMNDIILWQ